MWINPGDLNKKIEIIKIIDGKKDKEGFVSEKTEEIIRKPWAKVTKTSGTEIIKSSAEFSNDRRRFLIRYSKTPIDTDMIIRYKDKDYNIIYINNYSDNLEYVEIIGQIVELV